MVSLKLKAFENRNMKSMFIADNAAYGTNVDIPLHLTASLYLGSNPSVNDRESFKGIIRNVKLFEEVLEIADDKLSGGAELCNCGM